MANLEHVLSVFHLLYSPLKFHVGILNTIFALQYANDCLPEQTPALSFDSHAIRTHAVSAVRSF